MKKITIFTLLACALGMHTVSAQFIVRPGVFDALGVSNQGLLSGYETQAGDYYIWNPDTNDYYSIGGVTAGNGVGGTAKFSADGAYMSGTAYTELAISTDWQRNVLSDYNYIFKNIEFPGNQPTYGFAAGTSSTNSGECVILKTNNGGVSWSERWIDTDNRGIEAMSFVDENTGYVAGWSQYCAKTTNGGWDWVELDPAGMVPVYYYTSIKFKDDMNGVVGAFLEEGSAVYVTSDGGATWNTATGLDGIPQKICYAGGDTYFLVTNAGKVQKSTDNGLTWATVYSVSGTLAGISFYNESVGIATAYQNIYKTTDGGATWFQQDVQEGTTFRDVKWRDAQNLILAGSPDQIYGSTDGGATWTWDNQTLFNGDPALYAVAITSEGIHVSGSQGNFYRKSLIDSQVVAEMSRYSFATEEWTALGSLGNVVDGNTSAGFSISGDGHTVVGNAYANGGTHANGFAWNETEGTIDLGTMFADRNARGNVVSHDASVIAGYQDFNGPWKSAVWRKNPAGGYFPNQFLLLDPNGSATDENNQLGECGAISPDGTWIGGEGDWVTGNQPWIWSEATGAILLGDITGGMGTGTVCGISPDGNTAVGFFVEWGWGAVFTPFIWTATDGIRNMNAYVSETMGIDMGGNTIFSSNNMSLDGRYVAGWGLNFDTNPMFGDTFAFRLELPETLGVKEEHTLGATNVYPNPVTDILNISTVEKINSIEVYNVRGQLLLSENSPNAITKIDMSSFQNGIYFVKTIADKGSKTHKVIKN